MSATTAFLLCLFEAVAQGAPAPSIIRNYTVPFPLPGAVHDMTSLPTTTTADVTVIPLQNTNKLEPDTPMPGTTLGTADIVGIVIGIVLILACVALLAWCARAQRFPGVSRKRRRGRGGSRRGGNTSNV